MTLPTICPPAGQPPGCRWPARARVPSSAFTLIELMVVIVVIGILSAMILPEMKGTFGDALLRSSGRELVNVFSIACSRAVSLNQVQVVRLDPQNRKYSLEGRVSGPGGHSRFAPVHDVTGGSGQLNERIVVEIQKEEPPSQEGEAPSGPAPRDATDTGRDTVTFYPDGTADAADVLLRDQDGYGLRLKIDSITARVEVLEIPRN